MYSNLQNEHYIRVDMLSSAYSDNFMDWDKVDKYTEVVKYNDCNFGHHGFPPLLGFFVKLNESNYKKYPYIYCDEGKIIIEPYNKKDFGKWIFAVTDGHHRMFAMKRNMIHQTEVEVEYQYRYITND